MFNLIYTILPTVCLTVGFYFGYKIGKNEKMPDIKLPNKVKHPIQSIKEDKEQKEELEKINKIWNNIENYDGSSESQEEI